MTDQELDIVRREIERVVLNYAHIVDAKEWDRLGELFAEDGSFIVEGAPVAAHGLAAVRDFMESFRGHPLVHFTTNIVVNVRAGADRATARSAVFGPGPRGTASIGRYLDELVRTPEGWRFARRNATLLERSWPQQG